jgi:hypothetical protein
MLTPNRSQLIRATNQWRSISQPDNLLVHVQLAASKQAGGKDDRSAAFGTPGTQDRKPKSLKQIQAAENIVPLIFRSI